MSDAPPIDRWEPLSVAGARALFSPLGVPWWIAGGWAIDLFLGRQTREHADIDVAMLRGDHLSLRRLTADVDFYVAHDGELTPWDGAALPEDRHQFWAARRGGDAWAFEVLLEESDGDRWLFRRVAEIALHLDRFGRVTADGIPFVAPHVALLYKSNRLTVQRNADDFESALPSLDEDARRWLCAALGATDVAHPWIERL